MTKIEEYTAKAAESLAALEAATNERDRAFHRRAHTIWRRLIIGIDEAEERRVSRPVKTAAASPRAPERLWKR